MLDDRRSETGDRDGDIVRRAPVRRRPCDRSYRRLQWACLAIIAAIFFYGFIVARFVAVPRSVFFRLILTMLLCFNALWWSVADRRFARFVRCPRRSRWLRLAAACFSVLLNAPIFAMLVAGRSVSLAATPTWYAAAVTLWQIALVALMPSIALVRLAGLAAVFAARTIRSRLGGGPGPVVAAGDAFDPERRAILRTAFATAPMALLVGATAASRAQEGRLLVKRHALAAPWLPRRLGGLTITHISDLHVGRHFRPRMLPQLVDKANALDGDIVCITGDIVDNSNDMLRPVLHALGRLTHRYGLFLCIGNHDQIDGRAEFIRLVRDRFPLLINERRTLDIDGEPITVAGLDYPGRHPVGPRSDHFVNTAAALSGHTVDAAGPVVALSHHPHAFDTLASEGVPLTLAGHTHGGQLMWTAPGERPDLGIGRLLFRYIRGFYRKPGSTLFVNSGVGNWFPLRFRAPAEIVQIQLTV